MKFILDANRQARVEEHDRQRSLVYELAGLIAFAVNDPKNMPTFEPSQKAKPEPVRDEVAQAQVRGWMMAMTLRSGGTINGE